MNSLGLWKDIKMILEPNKKILFLAGAILALFLSCAVLSVPVDAQKTITVVDSLGNQVEIPYPVDRIAILTPIAPELIVALGAEDRVVGIDQFTKWSDEFFPSLKDKPSIGLPPMPNYEKIIDLKPQVVITFAHPLFCYPDLEDKLESAGIKVVRLDFSDPRTYNREVKILGQMLGKEKRAEKFLNFSRSWVNKIEDRVKDIPPEEKIRVYHESPMPYVIWGERTGMSYLITMVGGVNISSEMKTAIPFAPFSSYKGSGFFLLMNPESIVEKNPQVIIKDFVNPSDMMGGGMGMAPKTIGYTSKPDISRMARARDEIMNRPGFKGIGAVKNGDVYIFGPPPDLISSPRWPVALGYMAKWLYPDKFKDLDPEAFHAEWLKKWYGLEYKGVYVYP